MADLQRILDRVENNPHVSPLERSQQTVFRKLLRQTSLPKNARALSVSTGDGCWDYFAFKSLSSLKQITATDIVDNPVHAGDMKLLNSVGTWKFTRVLADKPLPFASETFDLIFHHDVIEHVYKPYLFLQEQYRVLKKGGSIVYGTPNLFRIANILKLLSGRLEFPNVIGGNKIIGEYIHVQEFYEEQLKVLTKEVGFKSVQCHHCYFGVYFLKLNFAEIPISKLGKGMCHYLIISATKPK